MNEQNCRGSVDLIVERTRTSVLTSIIETMIGKQLTLAPIVLPASVSTPQQPAEVTPPPVQGEPVVQQEHSLQPEAVVQQEHSLQPEPVVEEQPVVSKGVDETTETKPVVKKITKRTARTTKAVRKSDNNLDEVLQAFSSRKETFFNESREVLEQRLPALHSFEDARDDRLRMAQYASGRDWEELVRQHWRTFRTNEETRKESHIKFFTTVEERTLIDVEERRPLSIEDIDWYTTALSRRTLDTSVLQFDSFSDYFVNLKLLFTSLPVIFGEFFGKSPACVRYLNRQRTEPTFFFLRVAKDNGDSTWLYDCRLQTLSERLFSEITRYLAFYFRKVYKETYKTNLYTPAFLTGSSQDTEMRQIINNLLWCESRVKFAKNLMDIVKKHCVFESVPEGLPQHADDKEELKAFKSDLKDSHPTTMIESLFDSIAPDQITEVLSKLS
jgi:hypothetical protein